MAKIFLDNVDISIPILGPGAYSFGRTVVKAVGGSIGTNSGIVEVHALKGVSLHVREGDRVGIVGHNGAGKSTLLRVLAGIYEPTRGSASRHGSVASLTDLTMGMDMEASGIENIKIRAIFLRMPKHKAKAIVDDVVAFSELGEFVHLPVHTYSSGMLLRLAFAVCTAVEADILIMDEIIGAGDASFARKAKERLDSLVNRAKILVIASHHPTTVRDYCNRAILMDHGKLLLDGSVDEVLEMHAALQA